MVFDFGLVLGLLAVLAVGAVVGFVVARKTHILPKV